MAIIQEIMVEKMTVLDGTDIEVVSKYKNENRSYLWVHKTILTGFF
ncbi:hypothetical protein [Clostridium sp. ATCC 25772]|nr:hypothetical protein [Clostridium sp. ATCC 25772]